MSTIQRARSNPEFAKRVGIHFTMASRIRNGARMPSAATLSRIARAFDLKGRRLEEYMAAANQGQEALGAWIDANLFEPAA